jgi:putative transposase
MITQTCKIEIEKPLDSTPSEFYAILSDLAYNSYKALNFCLNEEFYHHLTREKFKETNGRYPTKAELPYAYPYPKLRELYPMIPASSAATIQQLGKDRFRNDKKQGLLKGDRTLSTFRRGCPFPLHNEQVRYFRDNGYKANLTLRAKGQGKTSFTVSLIVRGNYLKAILDRLLNKEYKIGMCQIVKDRRSRKWFLLQSYSFENNNPLPLDKNTIVGVDLGWEIPAVCALNNELDRLFVGDKEEILKFRRQIEQRRRRLRRSNKDVYELREGHGRKRKDLPALKIGEKINNFKETKNHIYARAIVNFALKQKAGIIEMEDLSNITDENTFLGANWTYGDLRNKIEYKAKEAGIEVKFINPEYTSQRCSECGYIDAKNRISQSEFICQKCEYKENADYNGAKNISMPDIEKIIQEQLKNQKRSLTIK